MLRQDVQFPLENKGSLKATWNIPLGWSPSKNLFAAQNNPRGEGMKTWRESLIPDDNAIRINRRSRRRPGLDSKELIERRKRGIRRSFNRLPLTLSPTFVFNLFVDGELRFECTLAARNFVSPCRETIFVIDTRIVANSRKIFHYISCISSIRK